LLSTFDLPVCFTAGFKNQCVELAYIDPRLAYIRNRRRRRIDKV